MLDHVGIAVPDLTRALAFYQETLGLPCAGIETVGAQRVRVAFLPVGDTTIELLEPAGPDSPIAGFLARRRDGGLHHLAFQVDDLPGTLDRLAAAGIRLIDRAPRPGGHGRQVAFLHPDAAGGVLIELCSRPEQASPVSQP